MRAWYEQRDSQHRVIVEIGGVEHSLTAAEAEALVSAVATALHHAWCAIVAASRRTGDEDLSIARTDRTEKESK